MRPPLLEWRDVSLVAGHQLRLDRISFELYPGEVLALVGPSGAGKTSLLKSLVGLSQGRWTGTRLWQQKKLTKAKWLQLRRKQLAWVPQGQGDALNPNLTLHQQLVLRLVQQGTVTSRQAALEAHQLLLSGLLQEHLHHRYARHLSGGEIQRFLILMARVGQPDLILLDEPTAALDQITRNELAVQLSALKLDTALLIVTHDLELVAELADRVGVMDKGRLLAIQTAKQFLLQPSLSLSQALVAEHQQDASHTSAYQETPRLIEVQQLGYQVEGRWLFRGLSWSIRQQRRYVVQGESGSGKSTLARLLAGWLPLQEGRLIWSADSQKLASSPNELVMLLPQQPFTACASHWTIAQILAEPLKLQGLPWREEDLIASCAEAGLPAHTTFLQRRSHQVSGGELQRVVLARALLLKPRLLIADEPTSALDPLARRHWIELLKLLQQQRSFSLLVFTHDSNLARDLGAEVLDFNP